MPNFKANPKAGQVLGGFDYGMFDFVRLFLDAIHGPQTALDDLDSSTKRSFFSKFEHDVSDHMPIWIRLPKPQPDMRTYR